MLEMLSSDPYAADAFAYKGIGTETWLNHKIANQRKNPLICPYLKYRKYNPCLKLSDFDIKGIEPLRSLFYFESYLVAFCYPFFQPVDMDENAVL